MPKQIHINKVYEPFFNVVNNDKVRYVILTGGRGSGKSFALSTFLSTMTYSEGYRVLFTRYTLTSAKDSIIPEFVEKLELLGIEQQFTVNQREVINNVTGVEILFRGIKASSGNNTAKLKSLNGVNIWVLDEAEELDSEDIFDTINLSIRDKVNKNLVILSMNPTSKTHWIFDKFFNKDGSHKRDDTLYIHTSYLDNIDKHGKSNLDQSFLNEAEGVKKSNLQKYNHLFMGHWTDLVEGALWNMDLINPYRVEEEELPYMTRIVVSIDPATTSSDSSDETGIVVVGKGEDGRFYVLDTGSMKGTPLEWARRAISLYNEWEADCILAETNQGGDMVEHTIRSIVKSIPYKSVHACRGKILRAEPISALYEQGLVSHLGTFTNLEFEMITYTGHDKDKSPNDLDAMVHGLTELSAGRESILNML